MQAEWRRVVARAASPWERARCPGFQPAPGADAHAREREAEWARAAAGGDPDALAELLGGRGIDLPELRRGLDDVEVARPELLPAWAGWVREMLEGPGGSEPVPAFRTGEVLSGPEMEQTGRDPDEEWALAWAFEPFVRLGREGLAPRLAACAVPVAPAAERRLLARLARALSDVSIQVLFHRLDAADLMAGVPGELGTPVLERVRAAGDALAGWRAVFEHYPVLARVMAVAFAHWRAAAGEMLDRLGADAGLLARELAGGGPLGELTGCEMAAGDPHAQGRAVAILRFSGGLRVVYKPRDLRVAAVYQSLVRTLNEAGLDPPLHERKVLVRGHHTWEEFVTGGECESEAEVRRYFRRMGMHARLLQLAGASDFTSDNVTAVGEHPVLIDLEMLTTPRLAPTAALSPAEREAMEARDALPLGSGIVTVRLFGEPGRRPADMGALGAGGTRQAPFRQLVARRGDDGQTRFVEEYPFFPEGDAAPRLDGRRIEAGPYLDEVEAGYVEMARCLRRCAATLAAPGGPLDALADAPVRFLMRDTHVYMRMLHESLRPARLRDGVAREICLERMWKARFAHPGAVRQEVESLRELDVPLFTSRPGTDALDLDDADAVPGFFAGPAVAAIRARLHALAHTDDGAEASALRTALALATPDHPCALPAPASPTRAPAPSADGGDWLAAANDATAVVLDALRGEDRDPWWIALGYRAQHDAWDLAAVSDDTLSGTCGLAMVLADLRRLGAAERTGEVARALLARIADRLERAASEPPAAPGVPFAGGFTGWGAWLHALGHGARALDDAELPERAARAAARLPIDRAANAPADAVGGRAGLLLGLLAVTALGREGAPALQPAREIAAALEAELAGEREPGAGAYPEGAAPLRSLPAGRDGVALALARAHAAGIVASGAASAWLESAAVATDSGQHLARLAIVRADPAVGRAQEVVAAARAFAEQVDQGGATPDWLEAAEVALAAHAVTGDEADLRRAREIGGWIVARRRAYGAWFPDRLAPDALNLSAVRGVAALAHLFTRLHAPGAVGSIRVLE